TGPRLDDISASSDETLTMYELARALTGQVEFSSVGHVIANHCRRLIPFALLVLYVYESATDDLEARYVTGENSVSVQGLRIPFGQRLSGWVASNLQTILNSDATLDLGETARAMLPRLRCCLSTPLAKDDQIIGVLSLYSSQHEGFNENHRRIAEAVAAQIVDTIRHIVDREFQPRHDLLID